MKEKITNPKVFISYAWASKDYEAKVLAFASQLVGDGIDVVLDKWEMSEGNDTFSFMERCVTDPSITNVLMLIDPVYAQKADAHTGGVGTETQIISAKVYQEVTQDKFIPIVFERDKDGSVCKPTYLQGRLHFDLTNEEEYDNTYQRLVKSLFGEEVYAKPKLGVKPGWVDQPIILSPKSIVAYDVLKKQVPDKVRHNSFCQFLKAFSGKVTEYANSQTQPTGNQEYIDTYDEMQGLKTDYLTLISYSSYINNAEVEIASCLEDIADSLFDIRSNRGILAKIFLHELFIYTIAHFWNNKDYQSVGYFFNRTYFSRSYSRNSTGARNYEIFYSGSDHTTFDDAVSAVDNQSYHSGTASHWVKTIQATFCTKEQFVFADLLCFNYSVYGKNYSSDWAWFPITYCYDNEFNSSIAQMAKKLISKEYLKRVLPVFGYQEPSEFAAKIKKVQESGDFRDYRYSGAFNPAYILGYFIKAETIATLP